MAAYQNWYDSAASTAPVSNTLPPALIPPQGSVLSTQPVPNQYTMNRATGSSSARGAGRTPKNTPVATTSQINQIMAYNAGNITSPMFPNQRVPYYGAGGGGGGFDFDSSVETMNPSTRPVDSPNEALNMANQIEQNQIDDFLGQFYANMGYN
tara:strand:+ start:3766 stop:4224 length:459 start_codon:yes stop_codon:yes gene_type:complete